MTENIKIRLALKALRELHGWSASDLSKSAGLPEYIVSRIETGKLSLDFATAVKLTAQLGVSLDLLASTASSLSPTLMEQELQLEQARADVKKLRRRTYELRQDVVAD